MTKTRFNELKKLVDEKSEGEWYDIDMLSGWLAESNLNVTSEEAFIMCACLIDIEALRTFEYKKETFYTESQKEMLFNSDLLKMPEADLEKLYKSLDQAGAKYNKV